MASVPTALFANPRTVASLDLKRSDSLPRGSPRDGDAGLARLSSREDVELKKCASQESIGRKRRRSTPRVSTPPRRPPLNLPLIPGETPLETAWSFWYDKKIPKSSQALDPQNYTANLKLLGSFNTVQGFWRYYTHLVRPSELPKDHDIHLFRDDNVPAWETYPHGGCWILKVKKRTRMLNLLWEKLLFAVVGEMFEEPDVVGVELSIRAKEDLVSVWNADNRAEAAVHFRIGEKLEQIFQLEDHTLVEYKNHSTSLKDRSTFRNAKPYLVTSNPSTPAGPHPNSSPQVSARAQPSSSFSSSSAFTASTHTHTHTTSSTDSVPLSTLVL
eukprot:gnl/Spiro4/17454_TR9285_c0_g1_i1.p1 gnl/Spiro4/17454_TR9285_c0_g1~~gnl/Spiro4/17454_TR9285_c0_g1_i1.p1  ORF type:complete len:339 (+),score=95.28 gnl/Spiro4/17454_TR9285_c0_g1_i1:33-1019(+)